MKKKNDEFSFKDLLSIFIPKIWLIALVALIFGGALGIYSAFIKQDTYTSTAMIMVTKNTGGSLTTSDRYLAADMVEPYEIVIKSDTFLSDVIYYMEKGALEIAEAAGDAEGMAIAQMLSKYASDYELTPSKIAPMITIKKLGDTEIFDLNVTSSNPGLSHAVAVALNAKITADKGGLSEMLTYNDVSTSTIDEPVYNEVANSKNVVRNTLIGLVGGALLTMIALYIVSMFDIIVRDRKKLDDNFDIPVLGVIPRFMVEEEGRK